MFGVHIKFKDGTSDWIDPVTEEPAEYGEILTVKNSAYSYEYNSAEVEKWEKYTLCKVCMYDSTSYGCTDEECANPRHAIN